MATTTNGIYYPNDYDSVADIPADMKKIAESVDTKIAENKTEINNIKTEQTTQNTNISNLQKDNTTNKQDITNIKAKDTEQDKYIAELEAENARLREDLNGLPKGQASGESIDLNDSAEMRFSEFYVRGNSKQETRAGYNLLNFDVKQNSRVTYNNEDGTITINGQGGFTLAFKQFTAKANTKYYIKWELVSGTVDTSKSNGNSFLSSLDNKNIKQGEFKESVVESDKDITGFWVTNMIVFTNAVIKFWANTNKSDFEQYGASPSPEYPSEVESCWDNVNLFDSINRNYYINTGVTLAGVEEGNTGGYVDVSKLSYVTISSVSVQARFRLGLTNELSDTMTINSGVNLDSNTSKKTTIDTTNYKYLIINADDLSVIKVEKGSKDTPYSPYGQGCINETICNKNLLDLTKKPYSESASTLNGAIVSINNGVLTVDATNSTGTTHIKSEWKPYTDNSTILIPKGTYYTSLLLNLTGVVSLVSKQVGGGIFTLEEDCYLTQWFFTVSQGNKMTKVLQIEEGQTATEYVEHKSQTYTIPTQQPMRAIGDIRDTFVKVDNKWFERHNIARLVLKGNGFWSYNAGVGFHSSSLQGIVKNGSEALSNKYKYTPLTWQGNYTFSINSTGLIAISDNTYSTVDDWKAHLAEQYANGTPVYVDFVLATPTDIECTSQQTEILNQMYIKAKSYKGVTHMYSTDNVSPVIDVTYKKDIETLFANTLVEGV